MLTYALTWLSLRRDRRGVTAMEYGLIAALIAVAIIGIVGTLGTNLTAVFKTISDKLAGATG